MKKFICNADSIPGGEQMEKDDLANRILVAGESVHSQSIYTDNMNELLLRLTAEGYQLSP